MKRLSLFIATALLGASLVACGAQSTAKQTDSSKAPESKASAEQSSTGSQEQKAAKKDKVQIKSFNGEKKLVDIEVPYDAKRLAVLDMASLDILQELGLGDRVVGSSSGKIDYLQPILGREGLANLGTVKEADLEAIHAAQPDLIFIGGRLAKSYDQLSQIAPVVFLSIDREKGVVESSRENAHTIASIFGLEDEVDKRFDAFKQRISALQDFAKDKTAIVGLVTKGALNVLGNDGRCSLIGKEVGFKNLGVEKEKETSTHGNEASFEFLVEKNPQYLFILDRDAAINAKDAKAAKEIVENDLTKDSQAIKNNQAVYLSSPDVWYIAEGGIHALDVMIQDLEKGLGLK